MNFNTLEKHMPTPIFNPFAKETPFQDIPLLDNEFDYMDDLKIPSLQQNTYL